MAKNEVKQFKKNINGVDYVAQYAGLSIALKAADETYAGDTSNTSMFKMAEYLFKYVIVEPKGLSVDDFESLDELGEVMQFASAVMKNEFREETEPVATAAKGKK